MTAEPQRETMTRTYLATNTRQFDRDARQLAAQGWVVTSISQQSADQGCTRWLIPGFGPMFFQPPRQLVVTYHRRSV